MQSLLELKQAYLKRQETQTAQEAQAAQALQLKREQTLTEQITPRVVDQIAETEGVAPSALHQALEVTALHYPSAWQDEPQPLIPNGVRATINLSYHTEIHTDFQVHQQNDEVTKVWQTGTWHIWNVRAKTLAEALVLAEQEYKEQEREEQAEVEAEQTTKQHRERQTQRQVAKQRLFERVAQDPTALMLVKLFVEITKDRAVFEQQLEQASENSYYLEDYYNRKLSDVCQRAEQAEHDADSARREADDYCFQVDDLEGQLSKSKQQAAW